MTFEEFMNPPIVYDEKKIRYNFGLALRYARKKAGVNQTDLSKAMKINRSCISTYETGKVFPTLMNAISICNVLGIKLDELLELCDMENYYVENVYRRRKK